MQDLPIAMFGDVFVNVVFRFRSVKERNKEKGGTTKAGSVSQRNAHMTIDYSDNLEWCSSSGESAILNTKTRASVVGAPRTNSPRVFDVSKPSEFRLTQKLQGTWCGTDLFHGLLCPA